jgi:hypothetical protein
VVRSVALSAALAGAVGSAALLLRGGQRNPSRLLMTGFSLWVLSPFAVLVLASLISKRWSTRTRATLYVLMLGLSVASLIIYGNAIFGPPKPQGAFWFVLLPPLSWLLIGIVLPISALISRRADRG